MTTNKPTELVEVIEMSEAIKHIVSLLAGEAARFRYTDDSVELVTVHRFDHAAFDHMLHHGWLESTAGCGGYKLSDAGKLAYLRSTDEMDDGKLVDPTEYHP